MSSNARLFSIFVGNSSIRSDGLLTMNRLSFTIYRLISFFIKGRRNPPYALTPVLYFLLAKLWRYRRKVIDGNIQRVFPSYTTREVADLRKRFYRQFSNTLVEVFFGFVNPSLVPGFVHFEGVKHIQRSLDAGRHVIAVAGHFYNWEWLGIACPNVVKAPVYGVYKKLNNPYFEKELITVRRGFGLDLIQVSEASAVIENLAKQGQPAVFILVADQAPNYVPAATWVEFFGRSLPFYAGVQRLSEKHGMDVVYASIRRPARGSYVAEIEPMKPLEGSYVSAFARRLEASILESAEGWLWSHKRWKHVKDDSQAHSTA